MTILQRHSDVEAFITRVRELSPLMTKICTQGSCYRFYLLLKEVFPEAVPFYDRNKHVLTSIDGIYYDISGEVDAFGLYPMTTEERESQARYVCDLTFSAIYTKCP